MTNQTIKENDNQIFPLERVPIDQKLKALEVTKDDIIDAVWDLPVNSYSDGKKLYFVEFSDSRDMSNLPLDLEILSKWYGNDINKIPSIPIDESLKDFIESGCSGKLSWEYNESKPECCSKLIESIDWAEYDEQAKRKEKQTQMVQKYQMTKGR